jgi:hypothetical protein
MLKILFHYGNLIGPGWVPGVACGIADVAGAPGTADDGILEAVDATGSEPAGGEPDNEVVVPVGVLCGAPNVPETEDGRTEVVEPCGGDPDGGPEGGPDGT